LSLIPRDLGRFRRVGRAWPPDPILGRRVNGHRHETAARVEAHDEERRTAGSVVAEDSWRSIEHLVCATNTHPVSMHLLGVRIVEKKVADIDPHGPALLTGGV